MSPANLPTCGGDARQGRGGYHTAERQPPSHPPRTPKPRAKQNLATVGVMKREGQAVCCRWYKCQAVRLPDHLGFRFARPDRSVSRIGLAGGSSALTASNPLGNHHHTPDFERLSIRFATRLPVR